MAEIMVREHVDEMVAYDAAISQGQHHLALGEYAAAVAAFTAAVHICPEMRLAYIYRSSVYELMGDDAHSDSDLAMAHRYSH